MRILFFTHPGTNSRDILLDIRRGFEKAGHETITWELAPIWEMLQRATDRPARSSEIGKLVATLIAANRIDASLGMWFNGVFSLPVIAQNGKAATFFDALNAPHIAYWLDAPQWAHDNAMRQHFKTPLIAGPRVLHVVNSPSVAAEMNHVLSFGATLAMPYGINEDIFFPGPDIRPEFDLVFGLGAGDPPPTEAMLAELARDNPDIHSLRAEQIERARNKMTKMASAALEPSLHAPASELISRLCASQLADRHTPILDRLRALASEAPLERVAAAILRDARLYTELSDRLRQAEQWERAFTITFLSQRLDCAVFGGGDLNGWPCRVQRLGMLDYKQQRLAYARGRIGLNVMRWQDDRGSNIKPLEISACNRPCLMARRHGLEPLLREDHEIVLFDTPGHALEQASSLLADPARADRIASAAHARTMREHTWTARAATMLAALPARS